MQWSVLVMHNMLYRSYRTNHCTRTQSSSNVLTFARFVYPVSRAGEQAGMVRPCSNEGSKAEQSTDFLEGSPGILQQS